MNPKCISLLFSTLSHAIFIQRKKTDRPYTIFAQKSPFEAEPRSEVTMLMLQRSCTAEKEMSKSHTEYQLRGSPVLKSSAPKKIDKRRRKNCVDTNLILCKFCIYHSRVILNAKNISKKEFPGTLFFSFSCPPPPFHVLHVCFLLLVT